MLMATAERRDVPCGVVASSHFEIENRIDVNGFHADIRRFGWFEGVDSHFSPEVNYIDYALGRRSAGAWMQPAGQRHFQLPGGIVYAVAGDRFLTRCRQSDHRSLCLTLSQGQRWQP